MNSTFGRIAIGVITIGILLSGCQGNASEKKEAPTPTNAPRATEVHSEEIEQWAVSARSNAEPVADSEPLVMNPNWGHATGAIGEWDTLWCSTLDRSSWIVGDQEELATLELFYEEAVIPTEIVIYAAYGEDQIVKVELLDTDGNYHEISSLKVYDDEECFYTLEGVIKDASYETASIRITVDSAKDSAGDRHQIDSVLLVGQSQGNKVDVPESQVLVEPPGIDERAYYDRPDDHPYGTYQVHVSYLLASDHRDRERDINGQIAKSFELANDWFAEQSGGQTFVLDTYQGQLDVTFHQLQQTNSEIYNGAIEKYGTADDIPVYLLDDTELLDLVGYQSGKLNIIVTEFESNVPWGFSMGSGHMFLFPRVDKIQTPAMKDVAYGFEFTVLHEMVHEVGFVPECATNHLDIAGGEMHVSDDNQDLMWAPDDPYAEFYYDVDHTVLDYGNDDYYSHGIPGCPDLADSPFLTPTSDNPYLPENLLHLSFPE